MYNNTVKYLGKDIRILKMGDDAVKYNGRSGTVLAVKEDAWGDTFLCGTWGRVTVYPEVDEIEIISKGE